MTKKRIVIFPIPAQKRVIFLLVVLLILMLFPFLEMISTALKSRTELLAFPPQWLPKSLQFMNFLSVWVYVPFGRVNDMGTRRYCVILLPFLIQDIRPR